MQCEAGVFPTSYIPTTGAAATRAIDSAIMATSPWYTNTLAAAFVADAMVPLGDGTYLQFDDGSTANRMLVFSSAAHTSTAFEAVASTTVFSSAALGAIPLGMPFKLAYSSTSGARQYALNGATGALGPGVSNPPAVTTLRLGKSTTPTGGSFYLRRVRYWPRALSNAELQSVTA
jgi:hypothetical protein